MEFKKYHEYRKKKLKLRYNSLIIKDKSFTKKNIYIYGFNEGFYEGFKLAGSKVTNPIYPEDFE